MHFALAVVTTTCRVFSQPVTSLLTRMLVSSLPCSFVILTAILITKQKTYKFKLHENR